MLRGSATGNSKVLPTRSRSGREPNIQVNWMNWLAVSCTPGTRSRCWPLPSVTVSGAKTTLTRRLSRIATLVSSS